MKHHKGFWLVGTVGVLLLAGEGVARFALGLGTPPLSVEHHTIEYLFKPGQDVSRFGNRILINEYGMRSPNFPIQRSSPDELRIMVFGDSVLNGGNLTDHDQLATTLVAQELANRRGIDVVVGNISAGSWGPGNWLAYAREYGFFDADTVVLVLSSHDYADNPTFKPLNPNTHPTQTPFLALSELVNRYLIRSLRTLVPSEIRAMPSDGGNETQSADVAAIQQGLADLEEFLLLAQAEDRAVVMVLHPTREEMQSKQMEEGFYKLSDLAVRMGVPIVSLKDAYAYPLANGIDIYRDGIHINNAGQQTLADILLEIVP